jgi:hypothetical protein
VHDRVVREEDRAGRGGQHARALGEGSAGITPHRASSRARVDLLANLHGGMAASRDSAALVYRAWRPARATIHLPAPRQEVGPGQHLRGPFLQRRRLRVVHHLTRGAVGL